MREIFQSVTRKVEQGVREEQCRQPDAQAERQRKDDASAKHASHEGPRCSRRTAEPSDGALKRSHEAA